jgi:hypothetical protein
MLEQGKWKKEAPHASEKFHASFEESIGKIEKMEPVRTHHKTFVKRAAVACTSIAAAAAVFAGVCWQNPVWASQLPLIGGIFADMGDKLSYGENYDEYVKPLDNGAETDAAVEGTTNADGGTEDGANTLPVKFTQKIDGNTVTLSESYCSKSALYLSMVIESEQPFTKTAVDTRMLPIIAVKTQEAYSFNEETYPDILYLEGDFVDSHTYKGVLRFDLLSRTGSISQGTTGDVEVPDSFHLNLTMNQIIGNLADPEVLDTGYTEEEIVAMPDEEWRKVMEDAEAANGGDWEDYPNKHENWWIEGDFTFDLDIAVDESQTQRVEVNELDENGNGILALEKTPFELTVFEKYAEGDSIADYFPVMLDAEGKFMETGDLGGAVNTVPVRNHDISTVYVYECDYDEYMDELKGLRFTDPDGFKAVMDEKAKLKAEVHFEQ